MRNNDLQEHIPSWSSLLLFSFRSKKTGDDIWTVGGSDLIAVKCWMMMNKRGTREGAKRKETHQLCPNNIWMDGWVLPKGGKSTIRTRLCTKNQSNLDNFDKNISVWPGLFLCPQYWRIPGASYEVIFEMLPTIVTFFCLDFALCFCRWSECHNRGVFIKLNTIIIYEDWWDL